MIGLDEKSSHVANLVRMAKIDGFVNHFEDMFLKIIVGKLGLSPQEYEHIIHHLDTIPVTLPKSSSEKIFQFHQLLTMMKMDLINTEEEIQLCRDLGTRMGFDTAKIEAVIEHVKQHMDQKITLDEIETLMS